VWKESSLLLFSLYCHSLLSVSTYLLSPLPKALSSTKNLRTFRAVNPPPFYHPPPPTRPFICSSIAPNRMPSSEKWIFNIAGVTFRLSQMKLCYFRTYKCRIFNFQVTYFQFPGHSYQSVQTHEAEEKLLSFIQRSWSDIRGKLAVLFLK